MKPSKLKEVMIKTILAREPILIVGEPGIGKTDMVTQVAKEINHNLITLYPAISEPFDMRGMPALDRKTNTADFVPFGSLLKLCNATEPTVCLIDDIGQANQAVQAALMHLLLARHVGDNKVSDYVTFISCTNDRTHGAGVTGITETIKSRNLSIIHLTPDLDDWIDWAIQNDIHPKVIGFMRLRGNELLSDFKATPDMTNSPSPRGTVSVSKIVKLDFDKTTAAELIEGANGKGYAVEFMGFSDMFDHLVDPKFILSNPDDVDIPQDNPSVMFAYCAALSHLAKPHHMDSIVKFARRLPIEFQVRLLQFDCKSADEENHETEAYRDWYLDYQKTLQAA